MFQVISFKANILILTSILGDTSFTSTSYKASQGQYYLKTDLLEAKLAVADSPLNSGRRKILPPIKERAEVPRQVSFMEGEGRAHSFVHRARTQTKPQNNSFNLLVDKNGALRAFTNIVETGKNEEKEKPVIVEPPKPKKTPGIWISPELEKIIYQMSCQDSRSKRRSKQTFATIDYLDSSRDAEQTLESQTLEQRIKIAEVNYYNKNSKIKENLVPPSPSKSPTERN